MLGDPSGFLPCTPAGVLELLVRSGVKIEGAEAVILGRGNIVGKPMAAILCQKSKRANATVTICHSHTRDIKAHCRRADILIAAMGVAKFVTADMVKPGAAVMDVGVNRIADPAAKSGSRLVGDVDFEPVWRRRRQDHPESPAASAPVTIAMLMQNTVRAAEAGVEKFKLHDCLANANHRIENYDIRPIPHPIFFSLAPQRGEGRGEGWEGSFSVSNKRKILIKINL